MELQYEKAMQEYELSYSDLPEDAQTGIDGIKDVLKGINMLEKRGKKITPRTIKRLKAMDKWVYYEILDHVQGTDKNEDEMPEDASEVVEDMKNEAQYEGKSQGEKKLNENDKKGYEIEAELKKMFESGKNEWKLEELKSVANKTYNLLFETYEEGGKNGVKTSNYSFMEKDKYVFVISKN